MSEIDITDLVIRPETPADYSPIREANEAAFGGADEADLVERLRTEGAVVLSLVAELSGQVAGHILFSRMAIETPRGGIAAAALAPLAVFPQYQRRGIGGRLIRDGLDQLRSSGERIVIVVGHPAYYPRFGFSTARARALESPFPPEAFMALELDRGALDGVRGRVKYPDAFGI